MRRVLSAVYALSLLTACDRQGEGDVAQAGDTIRDTVVIDGAAPGCASCSLEVGDPVRVGNSADRFIPRRVPDVLRDGRGTIYLTFDGWSIQPVLQYDSTGRFLRRIGRSGSGPGEYNMTSTAFVGRGDSLYLVSSERALIVYAPDGSFKRTVRIPGITPFGVQADGTVLGSRIWMRGEAEAFVYRVDTTGSLRDSFPVFSPPIGYSSEVTSGTEKRMVAWRHESFPVYGADGSIWTYMRQNYRLERHDSSGRPESLIGVHFPDRPAPLLTVPQADSAAALVRERPAMVKRTAAPVSDMARAPATRNHVMVDSAGLLWVVRNVPAPFYDTIRFVREDMSKSEAPEELMIPRDIEDRRSHTIVEVIDPREQKLLARVTLPFLGLPAAPGYIGRVTQDDDGFYVVSVYPLRLRR